MTDASGSVLPTHIEATIRSVVELHADPHRRTTPPDQRLVRRTVLAVFPSCGKPKTRPPDLR